jgi:CBS domain containing-hemolysin-like protein
MSFVLSVSESLAALEGMVASDIALPVGAVLGIGFVLVLVQGFFAGYETGVVSANPMKVSHLVKTGSRRAKTYSLLMRRRDRILALTLIGTNTAIVCATILVASRLGKFWTMLILAPVALIFGEIIAKSVFRHYATQLVLAFVYPIRAFYVALFPLVVPVTAFCNRLLVLLTGKSWQYARVLTREELRLVFLEGEESKAIESTEREMICGVIDLSTTMVKEIMVPRTRMVAVESSATQSELVKRFWDSRYSRMPVYKGRIDNVIGIVNVFDIIQGGVDAPNAAIERFVRPAYYVPDTKRVGELLQELRKNRLQMAIVVDEYGGTDGIVTLEDVIEEIFGEIQDEYDEEQPPIQRLEENRFLVDAKIGVEDANEGMNLDLPHGEAETLGGFVMNRAGKIPAPGESIEYGNVKFTIVEADERSISKVRVEIGEKDQHEP